MSRHVLAFQGSTVLADKVVHTGRPGGQDHIANSLLLPLELPEVEAVAVEEKVGEEEELGDELLDVVDVVDETAPGLWYGVELSVRHVEPAGLEVDVEGGEGLHPDHVVQHHGRVGVVRAVVELSNGSARVLKVLVLLSDFLDVAWVLDTHWTGQVPEGSC